MSILQGTVSLKRFLVLSPVPDARELQAGLAQDQFRPFQDGVEEERMGWCDWRNPLITPPDEDWVGQERFAVFGLRIDSRRVPPALLKAHVDLRLQSLQKEKDLAFIGKEARVSLQDEVKLSKRVSLDVGVRQAFVFIQPDSAVLTELAKLVDARKFLPCLERVLPLSEAAAAQELSKGGHVRGKIVLKVA